MNNQEISMSLWRNLRKISQHTRQERQLPFSSRVWLSVELNFAFAVGKNPTIRELFHSVERRFVAQSFSLIN